MTYDLNHVKFNTTNMKLFFKYIEERHLIYKQKELLGEEYPWTDDYILSNYKFTNVFRELDPGTKYVIDKIIPKIDNLPHIIFNIIIYRLFNKIETFDAVGIQSFLNFDRVKFEAKVREQAKLMPVFTNAFIVSPYSFIAGEPDKIARVCRIIDIATERVVTIASDIARERSSEDTFLFFKTVPGIGDFLGYQMAVDLGYYSRELFNEDEFTVAGPGAKSGIKRLFVDRGGHSYEDCIGILCQVQEDWFDWFDIDTKELFSDRDQPSINLMAMENCLCEISKYLKAHYNEGRPRNRYTPPKRDIDFKKYF